MKTFSFVALGIVIAIFTLQLVALRYTVDNLIDHVSIKLDEIHCILDERSK